MKALRLELGGELADDLYARHKEIDPRLTGKLLRAHPNFAKVEDRGSRFHVAIKLGVYMLRVETSNNLPGHDFAEGL